MAWELTVDHGEADREATAKGKIETLVIRKQRAMGATNVCVDLIDVYNFEYLYRRCLYKYAADVPTAIKISIVATPPSMDAKHFL